MYHGSAPTKTPAVALFKNKTQSSYLTRLPVEYTRQSRSTPHSTTLYTLHAPHSSLHTPHSTLYTPHFTLHTPYFTLHTPHFTPYTFHSTPQTGNRGNMYKTVQIHYCRKVFCVIAYPSVWTSVPLIYVWAFGFVGCILFCSLEHLFGIYGCPSPTHMLFQYIWRQLEPTWERWESSSIRVAQQLKMVGRHLLGIVIWISREWLVDPRALNALKGLTL